MHLIPDIMYMDSICLRRKRIVTCSPSIFLERGNRGAIKLIIFLAPWKCMYRLLRQFNQDENNILEKQVF